MPLPTVITSGTTWSWSQPHVAPGEKRPEAMLELAAEEPEHATRFAVKSSPEADDLVLARGRLGQTQRRLDGLGAPREELDAREAFGHEAGEQRQEPRASLGGEAAERQALELALQRIDVVRMTVTDAAHTDAGDKVDVLVAVLVDQRAALATRDGHAGRERERLQARREMPLLVGDDPPRPGPDLAARCHRPAPVKRSATCAAIRWAASSR